MAGEKDQVENNDDLELDLPGDNETGNGSGNSGDTEDDVRLQRAAEEEASKKGWVPKHKFKKDPSLWVDASEFLARGQQHNSALKRQVEELTAEIRAMKGTHQKFARFHEEVVAQKDAELASAIRQLKIQRSEAAADGDHNTAVDLDDRIEVLQQQKRELKEEAAAAKKDAGKKPGTDDPEAPDAAGTTDPDLEAWIDDGNQWFKNDAKLRNYAVAMGEELLSQGETLRGRAFLDKISSLMAAEFPSKFGNSRRERQGTAESGRSGARASGKTERDLPKADRELMEEFVAAGYMTKEKFLADYWSRNA